MEGKFLRNSQAGNWETKRPSVPVDPCRWFNPEIVKPESEDFARGFVFHLFPMWLWRCPKNWERMIYCISIFSLEVSYKPFQATPKLDIVGYNL